MDLYYDDLTAVADPAAVYYDPTAFDSPVAIWYPEPGGWYSLDTPRIHVPVSAFYSPDQIHAATQVRVASLRSLGPGVSLMVVVLRRTSFFYAGWIAFTRAPPGSDMEAPLWLLQSPTAYDWLTLDV